MSRTKKCTLATVAFERPSVPHKHSDSLKGVLSLKGGHLHLCNNIFDNKCILTTDLRFSYTDYFPGPEVFREHS